MVASKAPVPVAKPFGPPVEAPAPTPKPIIVVPGPGPRGGGSVPPSVLEESAKGVQRLQLTAAASGDVEAIIYGRVHIGASVGFPVVDGSRGGQNYLLVPCFHCLGEIDAVESMDVDNQTPPTGVTRTDYLGTSSQTADGDLVAAWLAQSKTYSDAMVGKAYSVVSFPPGGEYSFSNIGFTIRGKKVYDPRLAGSPGGHVFGNPATYSYSNNPALCLADLITSTTYGLGQEVDWDSFVALANYCDEVVGTPPNTEKRRTVGLVIDRQQPTEQWVETLRSYAGCWLTWSNGKRKAVIDSARTTDLALTPSQFRVDTLSIEQVGPQDAPTVVTIKYADTSTLPWNMDAVQVSKRAGVDAGSVPYRETAIAWPGCQSAGMAYREAFRRMKQAQLCDVTCKITLMDDGVRLHEGNVVELTDNEGFSAKPFRVTDLTVSELGRPQATLAEYDAGVYSSDYVAGPSNPDSSIPLPNDPPAPTGPLTATEELVQQQGSGLYTSRIKATWAAPTYPFVREYRVEITLGGVIQETGTARSTEYVYQSGPLKEGETYAINLYIVSITGAVGPVLQTTKTVEGKDDTPSDVTGFNGREVGGIVMLGWNLVSDLDNAGYEIKYALASLALSYADAELLDTVPTRSNRYSTTMLPAGDWRFYIKARDGKRTVSFPGGQYSVNAATIDLTVTLDTSNFLSERVVFSGEALQNMTKYTARPDPNSYFVTDFADPLSYGHAVASDAVGTFDDLLSKPFCVPHSAPGSPTPESVYTSDAYDFGAVITATWRVDIDAISQDPLGPDPTYSVLVSTDGINYTEHVGEQWTGEGRYAKIRARCAGEGTMLVTRSSTSPALVIDAVVRTEDGTVTTSASAPVTVTLQNKYTRYKSIQAGVKNNSTGSPTTIDPAFAIYDNVVLSPTGTNSFDLYAFDENGIQVAREVSYTFKGV